MTSTSEQPPSQRPSPWRPLALALLAVLGLLAIWSKIRDPEEPTATTPFVEAPVDEVTRLGLVALRQPSTGTLNVLVVFAQFQNEIGLGERIPDYATRMFDPDTPGSFTHYYNEMSFGQLQINATVLPRRYTSTQPASAFLADTSTEYGGYGDFSHEIMKQVDADVDFGQFDNNGPDGVPDSGDDDRIVGYVFLIMRSVPRNFLYGGATGIKGLGRDVVTDDIGAKGRKIMVLRKGYTGSIVAERPYAQTVGIMAHEFGHGLGLPDLYDTSFQKVANQDPADDSAGIGRWGLMGRGAYGWTEDASQGPSPMSAWTREQLGWVGVDNDQLQQVIMPAGGLHLTDVRHGGSMLKVFLEPETDDVADDEREYLLVEHLSRDNSYYTRQLPADGIQLWHIRPMAMDNLDERSKLVDLVCADGLFADAGFPRGTDHDLVHGGDNLDFWARDAAYAEAHEGNLGDASDLFDGRQFRLTTVPAPTVSDPIEVAFQSREGQLVARVGDMQPVATAILSSDETVAVGETPNTARLLPNYPNPFNPQTSIPFVLPDEADVRLLIYNGLGQAVRTLTDDPYPGGEHELLWDSRDDAGMSVASGVYLARLEVNGVAVQMQRMTLVR
ncbi:MAG: hypothetical protein HOM68_18470 [Gemmatimonadetes bacterium]|nr:hypothetical protein [Gemmatimonadota bacterium]